MSVQWNRNLSLNMAIDTFTQLKTEGDPKIEV